MNNGFKKVVAVLLIILFALLYTLSVNAKEVDQEQIVEYITEIADEYDICPELIMAIVESESTYNPSAKNGQCKGLMQVSEKWHGDRMDRLGVTDLFDPYSNILVGVDYLSELAEKYQDVGLVLMVYNGGHDYAMRIYEKGELSNYANKILERSAELERLHGK